MKAGSSVRSRRVSGANPSLYHVSGVLGGDGGLYVDPPALAAMAGDRPIASPVVRWQARRQPSVTNLRHETLRIDDPLALALLVLLDGTRARPELVAALAAQLPESERANAGERVATYLSHFALHGLLTA